MRIDYVLADPTGNVTVLVDTPIDENIQAHCGRMLLQAEPTAEQVGFLTCGDELRLRMAGGEFCGNAAMSAAALCYARGKRNISLRVSGADAPVAVEIEQNGNAFTSRVDMPRPQRIGEDRLPYVELPGITHFIYEGTMSNDEAERFIRASAAETDAAALGLMQVDWDRSLLTPLVYVRAADTLYWEHSCASGTAAAGAYAAHRRGEPVSFAFSEPGGVLGIYAEPEGKVILSGSVRLGEKKHIELDV